MALDALGADPCSLLNRSGGYADLWIDNSTLATNPAPDASTYPRIVANGVLKTYLGYLTPLVSGTGLDGFLLASSGQNTNSGFNLIQFLSGGGVAAESGINYRQLKNIVLRPSVTAAPETIVDTYIVGSVKGLGKTNYLYSTSSTPLLRETDFWNTSDQNTDGSIVTSPTSILGRLLAQGYLIKRQELYNPTEFATGAAPPTAGSESLVYLYKVNQTSGSQLTTQQAARKVTLEAKNLRFFAAFLAEYCFYRTRYEWLLAKFFTIYSQPANGPGAYGAPGTGSAVAGLFSGTGNGLNQYSAGSSISQADYIKGLVYHMSCLNTRMSDMRTLLEKINLYYGTIFRDIQTVLNSGTLVGSNNDLQNKIVALNDSSGKAAKYLSEAEFRKGALEYNAQKNRYGNVLLALYAFLNISALAVIFHLSK